MDDYGLYMATVVATAVSSDLFNEETKADSRLTVRILPHMKDVDMELLPKYPPFFRDEMITGNVGDLVWCICSKDFSVGYVLGNANYNTYQDMDFDKAGDEEDDTLVYTSIKSQMKRDMRSIWNQTFGMGAPDFGKMKVTYWKENCIHFVNTNNGGSYIMYSNGNLQIMEPNRFLVRIGNSFISIDKNGVEIASKDSGGTIALQSDNVTLGTQPMGWAVATAGVGESLIPSNNVKV